MHTFLLPPVFQIAHKFIYVTDSEHLGFPFVLCEKKKSCQPSCKLLILFTLLLLLPFNAHVLWDIWAAWHRPLPCLAAERMAACFCYGSVKLIQTAVSLPILRSALVCVYICIPTSVWTEQKHTSHPLHTKNIINQYSPEHQLQLTTEY